MGRGGGGVGRGGGEGGRGNKAGTTTPKAGVQAGPTLPGEHSSSPHHSQGAALGQVILYKRQGILTTT